MSLYNDRLASFRSVFAATCKAELAQLPVNTSIKTYKSVATNLPPTPCPARGSYFSRERSLLSPFTRRVQPLLHDPPPAHILRPVECRLGRGESKPIISGDNGPVLELVTRPVINQVTTGRGTSDWEQRGGGTGGEEILQLDVERCMRPAVSRSQEQTGVGWGPGMVGWLLALTP